MQNFSFKNNVYSIIHLNEKKLSTLIVFLFEQSDTLIWFYKLGFLQQNQAVKFKFAKSKNEFAQSTFKSMF